MSHKLDKANQLDKQKDKIRKLLELSLSDNENEASIALKQAMSLMNAHNITKDEVYGQNMANKIIMIGQAQVSPRMRCFDHQNRSCLRKTRQIS